jgi:hypothetical protein
MESVSDWFPKHVTPVHIGAYEVRKKPNGSKQVGRWFSYWTGEHWGFTAQTPDGAESCKHKVSKEAQRDGGFEWRGLTGETK